MKTYRRTYNGSVSRSRRDWSSDASNNTDIFSTLVSNESMKKEHEGVLRLQRRKKRLALVLLLTLEQQETFVYLCRWSAPRSANRVMIDTDEP